MACDYDLIVEKPLHILNRPLKVNYKDFFVSLTKVLIHGGLGDLKGSLEYGVDAFKELGITESPENMAWALVSQSLMQSITSLTRDYKDLLSKELDEKAISELAERIEYILNTVEVNIDASFFQQPKNLKLLDDFKPTLMFWLTKLGMDEYQANSFHFRFKNQFVLALHEEWGKHPEEYRCISEQVETPFTKATLEERSWAKYNAKLQEDANNRVFAEAFGLKEVYIRLRAYYEEKIENENENEKKYKVVCDLHTEIEKWIKDFDKEDCVRIVSGGPGSGKSSFAKMLASDLAEKRALPVLFIPLHYFNLTEDLSSAIETFIRTKTYLRNNPLDPRDGEKRLLLIFDGLDELSMRGKAADETAQHFVDEVMRTLNFCNSETINWQALITGRELSVQANSSRLRKERQVLHTLPYHLTPDEIESYRGEKELLEVDQRESWWKLFGKAKGKSYDELPKQLDLKNLQPITREPLLNYLVALSYEGGEITFDKNISLNSVYYDLLKRVHDRQYEKRQHNGSKHLEFKDFLRVLEEISLAVWHGNGRTASTNYLIDQCKKSNLDKHLTDFSKDAESGVVRLLTAFYFREFGKDDTGDKTFEFTHKSFGEYLTARRIIRQVKLTSDEISRNLEHGEGGWLPEEALLKWIKICGPTAIDKYLIRFIIDEIKLEGNIKTVENWQSIFLELLSFAISKNSPMENAGLNSFSEMMKHSRNSEESLLVIHSACADRTQEVLKVNWGGNTNFGNWLKRIQNQRSGPNNTMVMQTIRFLDLGNINLDIADLYAAQLDGANLENSKLIMTNLSNANLKRANLETANLRNSRLFYARLEGANLKKALLEGANLMNADLSDSDLREARFSSHLFSTKTNSAVGSRRNNTNLNSATLKNANLENAILQSVSIIEANLEGANLKGANLKGANLKGANLEGANLEGANLEGANLEGANLEGANLEGANLEGANLEGANLEGANLEGANLEGANLEGANLEGANLEGANLEGANLEGANLEGANLEGANLEGANLEGANLEGANLEGANLEGANLEGANLEGANLEGANLEGANLEGANLEGANLEGANLEGANLEGANLEGANLEGANLEGANLEGANLEGANLEGANLEGANLEGANLEGANLEGANLEGANLEGANIKGTSLEKTNLEESSTSKQ
ncbi:NACHT domain-containing protein [Leucothrix sargassi]|nr:NACHT domain-containing protein [Leucothrix sargassi]